MAGARKMFYGLNHFIFGWGFVQIALIGFAFFGAMDASIHGMSGLLLTVAALLALIAAVVAKLGGRTIGLAALLFVILAAQGFFINSPGLSEIVRGLHPVFGLVVMFMARYLAAQSKA